MAAAYLERKGYHILERNYRTRDGEIDLIAQREGIVVFVEVKTARSLSFGPPQCWVTCRKQDHLIRAAEAYLMGRSTGEDNCRFDVIAILVAGRKTKLTHVVNAFSA
jgi:putative endonuclease